ncbi:hypothetical protein EKK58_05305 [Candidatus Dependentiae bacterium]|nr:MAG: hypothetical protein EKK58_05305 [Candidatus Dependentiae bacterium]
MSRCSQRPTWDDGGGPRPWDRSGRASVLGRLQAPAGEELAVQVRQGAGLGDESDPQWRRSRVRPDRHAGSSGEAPDHDRARIGHTRCNAATFVRPAGQEEATMDMVRKAAQEFTT